ncbi:hypothetical protein WICMUC_005765 [Wickerhamomyces mucosus]|uniref:Uncharacterized protein n=1 Tax=Wickerhamomyces mucosus TaxID=1378264 RepID=A0A9P8P358_9ASCO|nr:hypothetical protein WICMUC_005765 [Wickerhamomyces mucosus]
MTPDPTKQLEVKPKSSAALAFKGPTTSPALNHVPPNPGAPPNLLKLSSTNSGNLTFSKKSFDHPCFEVSTPGGTKPCLHAVEQKLLASDPVAL